MSHTPPMSPHYRPPGTPTEPTTPYQRPRTITAPQIITGIGGLLLIGGAFLPWIKVTAFIATLEVSGVDGDQGDGWLTLACGAVALVVLLLANKSIRGLVALLAGAAASWVAISDLIDVRDRIDQLTATANGVNVHASVGIGLWASVAGAVVVVVGALLMLAEKD